MRHNVALRGGEGRVCGLQGEGQRGGGRGGIYGGTHTRHSSSSISFRIITAAVAAVAVAAASS